VLWGVRSPSWPIQASKASSSTPAWAGRSATGAKTSTATATPTAASITRTDIATFLLDQSTDPRFHRTAPAISN
jgi:hypothetical protein